MRKRTPKRPLHLSGEVKSFPGHRLRGREVGLLSTTVLYRYAQCVRVYSFKTLSFSSHAEIIRSRSGSENCA
jgi:hypothetical protein